METKCPIDAKCAAEISALLTPPPPIQVQEYFEELITERQCHGIKVKQDENFSKGVYASRDFREGKLILKDKVLVGIQHVSNKLNCLVCSFCFRFIESIEFQVGRRLYFNSLGATECNGCEKNHCSSSSSKDDEVHLPDGVIESLMDSELVLPYSNKFPLPSGIPCPGECGEAYYCSKLCAAADWESSHSLLCTGRSLSSEAMSKFIEHATETNDIFLLAAKTIAFTILRYRKLKAAHGECSELSLLLEAWKPISMGHKKRWWDCIAFPDDVDCPDEPTYRTQIQELAFTSLQLLKAAIFDKECEPLFSLEIYGNIIGMFELNNLDLIVESPVEDYFLYIDDLPYPEKKKTEGITKQLLDALGDDYSVCCEGTAFYALQSCMNHSCCPNAKAFKRTEDRDGEATIIAVRPIEEGEEVTISYIDEEQPFEDRQALLADYGFKCRCDKCLEEDPDNP